MKMLEEKLCFRTWEFCLGMLLAGVVGAFGIWQSPLAGAIILTLLACFGIAVGLRRR